MTSMSLEGTHKARKPFKCGGCGDTYEPPARYVDVIVLLKNKDGQRLGKWRWRQLCLFCVAYG